MTGFIIIIIGFYFSSCIIISTAHFTTNSIDMQNLLEGTRNTNVFSTLNEFIEKEDKNLELLKELVNVQTKEQTYDGEVGLGHPAVALKLIRGRAVEIPRLVNTVQEQFHTNNFDEHSWSDFLSRLPNSSDLGFIIKGLVRLMDIYDLKPAAVERGRILKHRSRGLNLDELIDICEYSTQFVLEDSVDYDMPKLTMDWLSLTSSRAKASDDIKLDYKLQVFIIKVVRSIYKYHECECSYEMEMAHKRWRTNNPSYKLPPTNWTCDENTAPQRCMNNLHRRTKEHENFSALCQHKKPQYFPERHIKLQVKDRYCKLDDNNHPLLILQPIKIEIRSPEVPYKMVEFHDLLSESEIDYLMENASGNMTKGMVNLKYAHSLLSDRRISEISFLPYEKHESKVAKRILARLSAISGLKLPTKPTELLTLANYATTGYFSSHLDYFQSKLLHENNRFVTFLLYLNDVDGGETVFPFVDVRVEARRGRGFMFNNMFRNNSVMMDVRHGGCPVITGDKWIVTHWVYRYGHEFSHQCSLNQFE